LIGQTFGQYEPLTTRIRNLVRSYPKGLGIFKEFIQNADDAEADEIVFIIDEQQHSITGLPENMHWLQTNPSMSIYNNKSFSDNDISGIQSIGASGKSNSIGKTGRFGLGFNACYNITDVPCFFTRGSMYFFDPHFETIPESCANSPGRSFGVNEILNEGWPLLDSIRMFVKDEKLFDGTVFRLPFRNMQLAATSKIKNEIYTVDDALQCVEELRVLGSEILIFLKHVKSLRVEHRTADGSVFELLSIQAVNKEEINNSKSYINDLLSCSEPENILYELIKNHEIYSSCIHKYRVLSNGVENIEQWRVIDGFFADNDNQVINACKEMLLHGEKALPYAGAAWKLSPNNQVKGQMFCFLPIPIQTSLPILINGYFDLDDSRQSMFLDSSSHGSAGIRVKWNKALIENSVILAYVRLLEKLKLDISDENINTYYSTFPKVVENEMSWEGWLTSAFYKYSSKSQLIKVSGGTIWSKFTEVRFLPEALLYVGDVLIAENFLPIPSPKLPNYIKYGYEINGIDATQITPHDLRILLKEEKDIDCCIGVAPRVCLRKYEYIEQILRFCLSDKSILVNEIIGLPLIVDYGDHIRTLGLTEYPLYRKEHQMDLEVFYENPEWFVKLDPNLNLDDQQQNKLKLYNMNDKTFVKVLLEFVCKKGDVHELKMRTGTNGIFTDEWLQAVFRRLLDSNLDKINSEIESIPLVPDQDMRLQKMGSSSTPLLFRGHNENLRSALSDLSVPLVKGVSKELFRLLSDFLPKDCYIWEVTPCDLIDTLQSQCIDILNEYDQFTSVQEALLDYLSKDDNIIKLDSNHIKKLKTLKIFPTSKGGLVDLNGTAYIPQNYSFPTIKVDVILLKCEESNQWHKLYRLLGIQELSRLRLILNWLLPEFENFDISARIEASSWLRDNLINTKSECENEDYNELYNKILNTSFIVCNDGELRTPITVYQPNSILARDILGNQALFPDMDSTYINNKDRWLEFFKQLDMPTEPRLLDVLKYISELTSDNLYSNRSERFQTVFDYIKERIDIDMHNNKMISKELSEVLEKLSGIAWIPIKREPGNFICYNVPNYSFARPGDVYFPRVGQLIASQAYITLLKPEPNKYIQEAMGFPVKISAEMVAKHFKIILETYSSEEMLGNESEFVKAISQIYRFFGGEISSENNEIEYDSANNELEYSFDLKDNFSEIDCIWDQELKRFWRPEYVFHENVRYMFPWRRTIKNSDIRIERGFDALGRKEKPTIEDWKNVLIEIAESGIFQKNTEIIEVVKEVLRHIVMELDSGNDTDGEVLVPAQDEKFYPAKSVYIADAPWYEPILDTFEIPILSQFVSSIWEIHQVLKISSLAESIVERISKIPDKSNQEHVVDECHRLERLIKSNDFIIGIQRLLQNQGNQIFEESLVYLCKIKIQCVKKINICLYLNSSEFQRFLGDSETDFYLNFENLEAMLVENRLRYFCNDLAVIINRTLKNKLKDLAPLVQILSCDPSEISDVLDDLKIRKYLYSMNDEIKYDEEEIPQVFPDEDEVDVPYENDSDNLPQDICEPIDDKDLNMDNAEDLTNNLHKIGKPKNSDGNESVSTSRESGYEKTKLVNYINKDSTLFQYARNTSTSNLARNTASTFSNVDSEALKKSTASYKPSKMQRRLISYVSYETENNSSIKAPDNYFNNFEIEKTAINIVLEYEKSIGWNSRSIADTKEGYNVISEFADEFRYITVKGIEAAWGERGVALTQTQFFHNKDNAERDYWLYVIENIGAQTPIIHKIHSPVDLTNYFMIDGGWNQVAESIKWNNEPIKAPKPGNEVRLNGSFLGIVELVQKVGKFQLVHYRAIDGTLQKKLINNLVFQSKED
jgi:sacsin